MLALSWMRSSPRNCDSRVAHVTAQLLRPEAGRAAVERQRLHWQAELPAQADAQADACAKR
jgi:hypothetical protein